jgi:hypothetical protein
MVTSVMNPVYITQKGYDSGLYFFVAQKLQLKLLFISSKHRSERLGF